MTPKEEAIELVQEFNYDNKHFLMYDVRKCALICVDKMIENLLSLNQIKEINRKGYYPTSFSTKEYWQEVKREIEKL